jgi:DNA-binding CsgD family transcriptional regulator
MACWSKQRHSLHPITEFGYLGRAKICNRCKSEQRFSHEKILNLVAQGLGDQEIADRLLTTKKTVSRYLQVIRKKTGIRNRILLSFYALGKGMVTQEEIKQAIQKEKEEG